MYTQNNWKKREINWIEIQNWISSWIKSCRAAVRTKNKSKFDISETSTDSYYDSLSTAVGFVSNKGEAKQKPSHQRFMRWNEIAPCSRRIHSAQTSCRFNRILIHSFNLSISYSVSRLHRAYCENECVCVPVSIGVRVCMLVCTYMSF